MESSFSAIRTESMKWYEYGRDLRKKWCPQLGIKSDNQVREQGKEDLILLDRATDIEYMFIFRLFAEFGVAHRGPTI